MTTLVRGAWALTMAGPRPALRDGAVAIDGGRIAAVGPFEELRAAHPEAELVGDGNGVVLPGFVNAHTHLSEGLVYGMGERMSLFEWGQRIVFPVGTALTREDARAGALLKACEMLAGGVTCVNDMFCHTNEGSLASLGAVDGLAAAGMRGVVSLGAEDALPGCPSVAANMAEHEALADRIAGERLISFRLGIGTVLGQSTELFEASIHACKEHGWAVHTHLAEVREEITESRIRHGDGTIGYSERKGLLDCEVIAGHCIWVGEREIALLRERHVKVAHNPVANMMLGSGTCPVPRLLTEGVVVGLGTDGAASNDNQDMLGAVKAAGLLQKLAALDPAAIEAEQVLRMATIEGARALTLEHEVGSLEPGKRADVVLLGGDSPTLCAIHDPWQAVAYSATSRDVSHVWVDGEPRVAAGAVLGVDLPAVVAEARALAADLAERAGLGEHSVLTQRVVEVTPPEGSGSTVI